MRCPQAGRARGLDHWRQAPALAERQLFRCLIIAHRIGHGPSLRSSDQYCHGSFDRPAGAKHSDLVGSGMTIHRARDTPGPDRSWPPRHEPLAIGAKIRRCAMASFRTAAGPWEVSDVRKCLQLEGS